MAGRTVSDLWRSAVAAPPSRAAFLVEEDAGWREMGWVEAGLVVDELAAGFLSLGVRAGDRVSILSRSRLEWSLCDWALISIGAIVVPIYPTSSALECAYILGNSGARFVVCEDAEQHAKLVPVRRELEALEQIVLVEGAAAGDDSIDVPGLREHGRVLLSERPTAVEEERERIGEDDVLTIVYTSGTTGPPKGCVLTQRNYRAMVDAVQRVDGLLEPGDVTVLYLPLAHTFARLVEFLGPAAGLAIAFCPDPLGVPDALTSVRPTIFPSVPRLYERVRASVEASFDEARGGRRRAIAWALRVGSRTSKRRRAGWRYSPGLALEHALADRLVFSKVRARLGGRLRVAISGGAPLGKEVAEFFATLGILILEGYGLTECTTAATLNRPKGYRLGTVGPALDGVELRIAPDGEILIRGEIVFQGYYRDDEATRSVLEGGWLASGDIGEIDADGFVTITDRKKDIIVTAGGKNVSPQNIEAALRASKCVSEALVVGDRRPYLVALLALDHEKVGKAAKTEEEVRALIEGVVAEVNRGRGRVEQIRRFAILPRDFSQERSELTPTLKVRRRVCEQHFREEIERLYGPS